MIICIFSNCCTLAKSHNMLSSWSSQGLLAHYCSNTQKLSLIDNSVPLSDPFYLQNLRVSCSENALPVILQWNASGTHLLLVHRSGSIEIFVQSTGLMNQFESLHFSHGTDSSVPIIAFWLENRRVFTCNYNSILSNSTTLASTSAAEPTNGLFTSKSFNLKFIPPGNLGFMILFSSGQLDLLFLDPARDFKRTSMSIPFTLEAPLMADSCCVAQRSTGQLFLVLRSSKDQLALLDLSEPESGIKLQAKCSQRVLLSSPKEKFIWSDSKELLFHLSLVHEGKGLQISYFDLNLNEVSPSRLCVLPSVMTEIITSNWNYFFLTSEKSTTLMATFTTSETSPLSLKVLQLEEESSGPSFNNFNEVEEEEDQSFANELCGPLIVSPNGLLVAKLKDIDNLPLLSFAPIGEILPKNVNGIRDLLGKLVASTLNGTDSWDIFRIIRRTLLNSFNNCEDSEGINNFISIVLSEWINLTETSNIPPIEFYPKLLDLFNLLPVEFGDASYLINLCLSLSGIEKILRASACVASGEEDGEMSISFENNCLDSMISLLPILKEGLRIINTELDPLQSCQLPFNLLSLNDEIFKSISLIFSASQAVSKHLNMLKETSLKTNNNKPVQLIKFYEQEATAFALQLGTSVQDRIVAFRSDPQIQSKITRNLFNFMIEFYLDPQNYKKVTTNLQRIMTRFSSTTKLNQFVVFPPSKQNEFFDSIKCINSELSLGSKILICRRCCRITKNSSKRSSRRELIFSTSSNQIDWQNSLWKFRCPCGSQRRLINIT